jgi:hypothetical protein
MTYTLEQLSSDIKAALKADPGKGGKEAVCKLSPGLPRQGIRRQAPDARELQAAPGALRGSETGFCVCGHVYMKPAHGEPHDHGSSWAIYGLAEGDTEMTDWKVVRKGDGTSPTLVEPEKVYVLRPGDATSTTSTSSTRPSATPSPSWCASRAATSTTSSARTSRAQKVAAISVAFLAVREGDRVAR